MWTRESEPERISFDRAVEAMLAPRPETIAQRRSEWGPTAEGSCTRAPFRPALAGTSGPERLSCKP